jgi:hypothetical protein
MVVIPAFPLVSCLLYFLFFSKNFDSLEGRCYIFNSFGPGGMAEWLKAAVLKTVVPKGTAGSNPAPSARGKHSAISI